MSAQQLYSWKGSERFRLTASGLHEDTLRVVPDKTEHKTERILQLVLPTLCITYADMRFQNAVGGMQANYPASVAYGPAYFDPPVELTDEAEIERLTYIRGARRVEIGPRETIIEFGSWNDLVVPRLRLDLKKPAEASLFVPETTIHVEEPLSIALMQYADGRHIGGVRLEKRHPDWVPPEIKEQYELWIRVIDGVKRRPLPETMVNVWRWEPDLRTPFGKGGFKLDDRRWTGGDGSIDFGPRPSGVLETFTVDLPGWRIVPRCLKPLPGQKVRFHMRAWPLTRDAVKYDWKKGDRLDRVALLTGHPEAEILKRTQLRDARALGAGMHLSLPCFAATYQFESWDNPDWIGAAFGYQDAAGLADVNGWRDLSEYDPSVGVRLPDWRYFYARSSDTLDTIDETFGLPRGSSRTVGRVYRPEPRLLFTGETVAVPSERFAKRLAGK